MTRDAADIVITLLNLLCSLGQIKKMLYLEDFKKFAYFMFLWLSYLSKEKFDLKPAKMYEIQSRPFDI